MGTTVSPGKLPARSLHVLTWPLVYVSLSDYITVQVPVSVPIILFVAPAGTHGVSLLDPNARVIRQPDLYERAQHAGLGRDNLARLLRLVKNGRL